MRSRRLAFALLVATAAGCAHVGTARLRIRCCVGYDGPNGTCHEEPNAKILLDGAAAGTCNEWGGDGRFMEAGRHHITAKADSPSGCCVDDDLDVELQRGGRTAVRVYLERFPD